MNQRTACAWLERLAMCCWLGMSAMAGDVQMDGARSLGKSKDLFELSPAELAQLEITPINVLGSHMHLRGQWMVGYRFMFTDMRGNLDGTRSVSVSDVLQNYPVAHTRMTMEMHMLEVMYAPSDKLTFMAMGVLQVSRRLNVKVYQSLTFCASNVRHALRAFRHRSVSAARRQNLLKTG